MNKHYALFSLWRTLRRGSHRRMVPYYESMFLTKIQKGDSGAFTRSFVYFMYSNSIHTAIFFFMEAHVAYIYIYVYY